MILGFKPDFAPLIISGTKVHTIRASRRWVAGQLISFCTILGPDNFAKFQPDGVARTVQTIRATQINGTYLIEIDGRQLPGSELVEFVRRDGFESADQLFHFLAGYHGLPFVGQLIHWTDLVY
ncbi:ASCH domain-containing protein [Hymenobacter siberiensis]|uniref:ASCH domain-containing protein n=1 Tax=Hymenobacter siberiensis TaxID=2848396 RepID=UPI001C1E41FA|nr:ASCH domain-containing protein [Hymenobacter siberiensis]MBU6122247.1 ASCH domain-containing protein [Hymenobacter siberiensis]